MSRIRRLELRFDLQRIESEIDALEAKTPFKYNALCLTHPEEIEPEAEKFHIGCGSMYVADEKKWRYLEPDFNVFHEALLGSYLHEIYLRMQEHTNQCIGRFRIMRLNPKTSYTMHEDADSPRFHVAVRTNRDCLFIFEGKDGSFEVGRIPNDGHVYEFDARDNHTAINASLQPRTHLVFSNTRLWIPVEEQVYLRPLPQGSK